MKYVLIGLLKVYRLLISPLYGDVCRYYPSCSAYALGAVRRHGAIKGSWLSARRLLRCHPWAAGGYDPVPGTEESSDPAPPVEHECVDQGQSGVLHAGGSALGRRTMMETSSTSRSGLDPRPTMGVEAAGGSRVVAGSDRTESSKQTSSVEGGGPARHRSRQSDRQVV